MARKSSIWQPYRGFFEAGRIGTGFLVLLMQLSLVFWPLAIRLSRQLDEERNVQHMLNAIAQDYPVGPERMSSKKRFRHVRGKLP